MVLNLVRLKSSKRNQFILYERNRMYEFHLFFTLFVEFTGMLAPMLVQMERQIDREIAADNKANGGTQTDDDSKQTTSTSTENGLFDTDSDEEDADEPVLMYGPQPQIITNDLKSLDEMVSAFLYVTNVVSLCRNRKYIHELAAIYSGACRRIKLQRLY